MTGFNMDRTIVAFGVFVTFLGILAGLWGTRSGETLLRMVVSVIIASGVVVTVLGVLITRRTVPEETKEEPEEEFPSIGPSKAVENGDGTTLSDFLRDDDQRIK